MHTVSFDGTSFNKVIWPNEPDPRPNWTMTRSFIRYALTSLHSENPDMPEEEIRARVKEALEAFDEEFAVRRWKARKVPRIQGKLATGRSLAFSKLVQPRNIGSGVEGRGQKKGRWCPPSERGAGDAEWRRQRRAEFAKGRSEG